MSTRTSAQWRSNGEEIERLAKDRDDELEILERSFNRRVLQDLLMNQIIVPAVRNRSAEGSKITQSALVNDLTARQLAQIRPSRTTK